MLLTRKNGISKDIQLYKNSVANISQDSRKQPCTPRKQLINLFCYFPCQHILHRTFWTLARIPLGSNDRGN